MKLIFIDWQCFGRRDLLDCFQQLGHTVILYPVGVIGNELKFHMEYIEQLIKEIEKQKIQFIFSMNYYPSVSEACQSKGISYISWVYDNPYSKVYGINIINDCNYIFTFNQYTYRDLMKKGVKTIYYAPLAVNTERLDQLLLSHTEKKKYGAEVSFVGRLYNEEDDFYKMLSECLKKNKMWKTLGFLDGIIDSQLNVYGTNFLEHCLPPHIMGDIQKVFPYQKSEFSYFTSESYMYASYTLSKRVTELDRIRLLEMLSSQFEVKVYTPGDLNLRSCIMCEPIDSYEETPKVFRASKINLNITLRSIETGIPLRAMDIMGAGGFLLSNYQEDFLLHFEPDRDFVFYENSEDLSDKIAYYLAHNTEREKISRNGHERVARDHTYLKRVAKMIQIATKNK